MAIKQTRRTVSIARSTHDVVLRESSTAGVTASEWITQLIRQAVPDLPKTVHFDPSTRQYKGDLCGYRHKPTAPAPAPVHRMDPVTVQAVLDGRKPGPRPAITRATIDAFAARRRLGTITPGTLCANCVDSKATHIGRVDTTDWLGPLCDACELPDDFGAA